MSDNIIFKYSKNHLEIYFSSRLSFKDLLETFKDKFTKENLDFIEGKIVLEFSGRKFTASQEQELLKIVMNSHLKIHYFVGNNKYPVAFGDRPGDGVLNFLRPQVNFNNTTKKFAEGANFHHSSTLYHNGSLRSGDYLKADGNLVILGDVNSGAKVEAAGNIIVLGYFRGIAFAGNGLGKKTFIIANGLAPIQLQIDEVMGIPPSSGEINNEIDRVLEIAYIEGNQIVIDKVNKRAIHDIILY